MRYDIVTIFPNIFSSYLKESILKRAQKNKLIEIKIHNLRDFTKNKHKKIDDRAYGGGPGMVMMAEPIIRAIEKIRRDSKKEKSLIVVFSAAGKQFDNKMASDLSKKYNHLIFICGRYEGIDERVKKMIKNSMPIGRQVGFKIKELSVGPYVLTGGEIPAMTLIDSISRQIPGVLGKNESLEEKRYGVGVPVYTRPETIKFKSKKYSEAGLRYIKQTCYKVPGVLLSGNHKEIEEWRKQNKARP